MDASFVFLLPRKTHSRPWLSHARSQLPLTTDLRQNLVQGLRLCMQAPRATSFFDPSCYNMSGGEIHNISEPSSTTRHVKRSCYEAGIKGRRTQIRNCAICGDKAHSLHFGGLSCDSCKAFFRRSVQSGAFRTFSCSRLGGCVLTITTRRSCQKCRFSKCVSVGMEPEWVLSEQKRHSQLSKQQFVTKKRKKLSEVYNSMSRFLSSEEQEHLNKVMAALHAATSNSYIEHGVTITGFGVSYNANVTSNSSTYCSKSQQLQKKIEACVHAVLKFCAIAFQAILPNTEINKSSLLDICFIYIASVLGTDLLKQTTSDFTSADSFCSRSDLPSVSPHEECSRNRIRNKTLSLEESSSVCSTDLCSNFSSTNSACMVDKCELQDFNKLEANQYYKSYGSRSQKGLCCPVEIQLVQRISELQLDEKSLAVFIIIILLDPYNNNSTSNEATTESLQEYFSLLLQRYMIWRYGQPQALLLFAHTLLQLSSVKAAIYHGNTCTYNRSLISLLQRVVPKSWHNSGFNMEQISSALYGNEQPVFLSPSQQESNSQGSIGQIPVNISENNQYFHYHMVGNSEKSNHMFSHYTQINSLNALHSSTNIQASLLTNNDCTSKIASLPTETHFSYHKYGLPYSDTGNSQMHTQRHNISDSLQQTSEDQKNFTFNNTSFFDPQYVMPTDLHQQECDTYLPTFKPSCSPSYDQMLPDSGDLAYSKVIMEQLESAVNSSCKTTPESLSFCTDAKKHYNSELDACHNYGQGTENQYCFQQVANAAVPVCDVVGKRYYDNSSGEQCISVQDKEVEQDQENIGIDSFVKNMSSCSVSESGDLSFVHHDNAHSQEKEFSDCQLLDDMLKESSNQLTTPEDDTSFQKDIQTICPPDWWLQDITVCPGSNSSGYISSSSCQLSPQLPSSLSQSL